MLPREEEEEEEEEDCKTGRAFLPLEEKRIKDARVRATEKEVLGNKGKKKGKCEQQRVACVRYMRRDGIF